MTTLIFCSLKASPFLFVFAGLKPHASTASRAGVEFGTEQIVRLRRAQDQDDFVPGVTVVGESEVFGQVIRSAPNGTDFTFCHLRNS
jgi:hypothetical protein